VPGTITSPIYLSGVGNTNNIAGFEAAITDNALTGDVVFSGPISVVSNTLVDNKQAASGHDLIFSGVISGTGTFNTFTEDATLNNGAVVIAGTSPNTFNGSLMNQGGRLELAKSGAAPHNVTVKDGIVYVTNPSGNAINGFLNLDTGDAIIQSDLTLTGLAGTGIFGVAADTQVTLDISDMDTFNGILSDDSGIAGARSIIKTGSGEFISTSSFPTNFDLSFPITFKVAQGSASFTNPNPNELDVVVDGGTLKGTGQLGTITASSGDVSPGNSPGCLTSNGNVDLGSSSSFDVEIAGTTLCTEYDQLISQGTIDLGNAELGLTLLSGYSPSVGDTFTIIRGTSISGHFANLADGAEFVSGTTKYRVNYTATTVVLTVTQINIAPALPTTGIAIGASVMTALLLLATGFVLARRRRPLL
jgi:hypothetical protein